MDNFWKQLLDAHEMLYSMLNEMHYKEFMIMSDNGEDLRVTYWATIPDEATHIFKSKDNGELIRILQEDIDNSTIVLTRLLSLPSSWKAAPPKLA